jgi:hypothetical protein
MTSLQKSGASEKRAIVGLITSLTKNWEKEKKQYCSADDD